MKQSSDSSDHNPFDIFNNLFGNSPFFNNGFPQQQRQRKSQNRWKK